MNKHHASIQAHFRSHFEDLLEVRDWVWSGARTRTASCGDALFVLKERYLVFLLSLGSHSKEACDEGDLPIDVSFPHSVDVPLGNHVHRFIPLERPVCCLEGKEAHTN